MEYKIEIVTKDFEKHIVFSENGQPNITWGVPTAWEDYCYAMGLVIEDEITIITQNNLQVARLVVPEMRYDDVLDIMCEDLSQKLIKVLTDNQKNATFNIQNETVVL